MKPIILALIPLLLLVSCADTSDLEARISQLEQQNTQLEKETTQLKQDLESLKIATPAPDKIVSVFLKCEVTKNGRTVGLTENCPTFLAQTEAALKNEGVLLEAWYELVIKTSQGNTFESKVTHDSLLTPPKIGDTWPLDE
jgi:hypothetical protein